MRDHRRRTRRAAALCARRGFARGVLLPAVDPQGPEPRGGAENSWGFELAGGHRPLSRRSFLMLEVPGRDDEAGAEDDDPRRGPARSSLKASKPPSHALMPKCVAWQD